MYKVFIDGQSGTTGLQIQDRLAKRDDIELLEIDDSKRKDPDAKQAILNEADVTILCLPDDAARETVALAAQCKTRILDASTAHRVHADWAYGLPELQSVQQSTQQTIHQTIHQTTQREAIRNARYVSNPGCYPTGFLLALQPLIVSKTLKPSAQFTINAVSGYSGGGKNMIEAYEAQAASGEPWWVRPYALSFGHKHVPEMQHYAALDIPPLFTPSVGHYKQGMLVSIPLAATHITGKLNLTEIQNVLADFYDDEPCVHVHEVNCTEDLTDGFLNPQKNNDTNRNDIYVYGNEQHLQLISILDNLGKGASGAAVQNLNLMLGADEFSSLTF